MISAELRRQQVISGFIADFYCHRAALVIEVDGSYHHADSDAERDSILAAQGISVLRFTNEDVLQRMENVLADIERFLRENNLTPPAPLP